jgi:1-deoxy-D-xylulose-5-phosphate reductoisomerase
MGGGVKRIAILGSTGSIGSQTLEVVRNLKQEFRVIGLGAGSNIRLLEGQVREFRPQFVSFQSNLAKRLEVDSVDEHVRPNVVTLEEMASIPEVDLVVIATSGKAGLAPTLAAIRAGKQIALANKEVLVMAGEIVMAEAMSHKVSISPVDSEHSAIWQCLRGEPDTRVSRLILTASGGPFRQYPVDSLAALTPDQALKHPTWRMGRKVTVDSATLMNKGMEIIEARWLFNVGLQQIDVVIHPESIVHSMVQFADGSIKAQLSQPDMRLAIQYALTYPDRLPNPQLPEMKWDQPLSLHFEQPDVQRFPCLGLARVAAEKGGTFPAVLCAADEVAVDLFLSHRIGFMDIPRLVDECLAHHQSVDQPSLKQIMAADAWSREYAENWRSN